jgi:hypothetical protein
LVYQRVTRVAAAEALHDCKFLREWEIARIERLDVIDDATDQGITIVVPRLLDLNQYVDRVLMLKMRIRRSFL